MSEKKTMFEPLVSPKQAPPTEKLPPAGEAGDGDLDPDDLDIFTATAIAAQDGLRIGDSFLLHPIFPCLACCLLCAVQLMLLFGVALEVKQKDFLNEKENPYFTIQYDMSCMTDLGLLAVVQINIFSEMTSAVRTCLYVVRKSWADAEPGSFSFRLWSCMLLAVFANVLKGVIAYLTSKVSVSVVLSSSELTEKIFNSLALSFILEVDEKLAKNMVRAFDLNVIPAAKLTDRQTGCLFSTRLIILLIMSWVYVHQSTNVIFALCTGYLPTTRTICQLFAHAPGFLYDGKGWGAQALQKKMTYCHHDGVDAADSLNMYQTVLREQPKLFWGTILVVLMGILVVIARDCCILKSYVIKPCGAHEDGGDGDNDGDNAEAGWREGSDGGSAADDSEPEDPNV